MQKSAKKKIMDTKTDKSVGIRLPLETYEKLTAICQELGDVPLNRFAHMSIESSLEMITNDIVRTPKWIAVQRFKLNFKEGDELS